MDADSIEHSTRLLERIARGERAAESALFDHVYTELRQRAHALMRHQPAGHSLQTTALVHEAWLKLCARDDLQSQSRLHFLRVATTAMRSILVDYAREQATAKHGGKVVHVSFDEIGAGAETAAETVLALDEALVRLREVDDELALTAQLKLFSSLSMDEIATALGSSKRTAARAWSLARAWLRRDLGSG